MGKKDMSIKQLLDSVMYVEKVFDELKPQRNKNEFEHYRLMAKTRSLYVHYQYIEYRAGEDTFAASQIPSLLPELKGIIEKTKKVNAQYLKKNKKEFYSSELALDNDLRIAKMQLLYNRLSRMR